MGSRTVARAALQRLHASRGRHTTPRDGAMYGWQRETARSPTTSPNPSRTKTCSARWSEPSAIAPAAIERSETTPAPRPRRAVRARTWTAAKAGAAAFRSGDARPPPVFARAANLLASPATPPDPPRTTTRIVADATRRGAQQCSAALLRGSPADARRCRRVRLRAIRQAQGAFPPRRVSPPPSPRRRPRRVRDGVPTPRRGPRRRRRSPRPRPRRPRLRGSRRHRRRPRPRGRGDRARERPPPPPPPRTPPTPPPRTRVSDPIRSADDRERPRGERSRYAASSPSSGTNPREHRLHESPALHAVLAAEPENPDASFVRGAYRGSVASRTPRPAADARMPRRGFPRGVASGQLTPRSRPRRRDRVHRHHIPGRRPSRRGRAWRVSDASRARRGRRALREAGGGPKGTRRAPEKIRPSRSRRVLTLRGHAAEPRAVRRGGIERRWVTGDAPRRARAQDVGDEDAARARRVAAAARRPRSDATRRCSKRQRTPRRAAVGPHRATRKG